MDIKLLPGLSVVASLCALVGCSTLPSSEAPAAPVAATPAEELDLTPSAVGSLSSPPGEFVEVTWVDSHREVAPRKEIETTRAVRPTMATGKKTKLFAHPESGGAGFTPADAAR